MVRRLARGLHSLSLGRPGVFGRSINTPATQVFAPARSYRSTTPRASAGGQLPPRRRRRRRAINQHPLFALLSTMPSGVDERRLNRSHI